MKYVLAGMMICFLCLTGCAGIVAQFVQFDSENAAASREFADDVMVNWSLNSGFWHCLLQLPKVTLPIGTPDAIVALLGNTDVQAAILQLDITVQAARDANGQPYWSADDYAKGCVEGLIVRGIEAETMSILALLGSKGVTAVGTLGTLRGVNPKALLRLRKK